MNEKAVVLLSGGLDSATVLASVRLRRFDVYALTFCYGQRHVSEIERARELAQMYGVIEHVVMNIDLQRFGASSLLGVGDIPTTSTDTIPSTYVPARNLIFLSVAVAWAESIGAADVFLGINAIDFSGYPDCRPAFLEAFQRVVDVGTRAGQTKDTIRLNAPLLHLSKSEIITKAIRLGVPIEKTLSCYNPAPNDVPCGRCDACRLREQGLAEAGLLKAGR